ncbi:MAG: sterol desaturase family protein [Ilumatobacteraceae bacterium]
MGTVVVAVVSFLLMEPLTALTHRCIMHGVGQSLHRSHHRRVRPGESPSRWEANDWFPVMFAAIVLVGFALGFNVAGFAMLVPVGVGVTAYGAAYALVHDVYIHRRLPLFGDRRVPVLERLAAAHRVHHDRNGAPYGMLLPVVSVVPSSRPANGSRPSHEPLEA